LTPILVFDIETIPDCAGIRRIHDLPAELPDQDVAQIAFQRRRVQTGGSDFLPVHLHRVVVISCVLRNDDGIRIFSIGEPEAEEAPAIQRFFDGINKYLPQIVSWNGRGFDLMDVLSLYGGRGSPLDELARLAGFPGKIGVGGGAVWESYRAGRVEAIRNYCEADTVNTYLLFLRFQLMRCAYTQERYASECQLLRATLEKRPEPHWREFLSLWKA
jgi:hypothetical protein